MRSRFCYAAGVCAVVGTGPVAAQPTAAAATVTEATPTTPSTRADDKTSDIVVTGRVQKLYRAPEVTIGKVPADPLDIPQSVQVITRDFIEDIGARDAQDLYRSVSGISRAQFAENISFRGFYQDEALRDGLRGYAGGALESSLLFNIDRVEYLKGPAGMLYGPGAPGGTINYVTQKPSDKFNADLRAVIGNYDRRGVSGAVSGPLLDDGAIAYRIAGYYEDRNQFRDYQSLSSTILDAGLRFRLAPATTLTLQATYTRQNQTGSRDEGESIPTDPRGHFYGPITFNPNDPKDYGHLRDQVYQALFESKLSDAVSFNAAARYFYDNTPYRTGYVDSTIDTNGDGIPDSITRESSSAPRKNYGTAANLNVIAHVRPLGIQQTILAGGDWLRQVNDQHLLIDDNVTVVSFINPQHYPVPFIVTRTFVSDQLATRYGVYLQDQIALGDRWSLLGGVRQDWFRDNTRSRDQRFSDNRITKRAGLIYKPRPDISAYVSYSDTFQPQDPGSQDPANGGPFAPITGDQIEGGVKTTLFGGKLQSGLAVYRIRRRNLLQTDFTKPAGEDGSRPSVAIGEAESKGVELDLAADLTPNWVLTFNYAYNDTKVTKTTEGQTVDNSVGDAFPNAPHNMIGFFTRYQVQAIKTAFGFGGQYVSLRVGDAGGRVPAYAIFDASVIKSIGRFELLLRVQNLFNKTYAVAGADIAPGESAAIPGTPRTVFTELRAKF